MRTTGDDRRDENWHLRNGGLLYSCTNALTPNPKKLLGVWQGAREITAPTRRDDLPKGGHLATPFTKEAT